MSGTPSPAPEQQRMGDDDLTYLTLQEGPVDFGSAAAAGMNAMSLDIGKLEEQPSITPSAPMQEEGSHGVIDPPMLVGGEDSRAPHPPMRSTLTPINIALPPQLVSEQSTGSGTFRSTTRSNRRSGNSRNGGNLSTPYGPRSYASPSSDSSTPIPTATSNAAAPNPVTSSPASGPKLQAPQPAAAPHVAGAAATTAPVAGAGPLQAMVAHHNTALVQGIQSTPSAATSTPMPTVLMQPVLMSLTAEQQLVAKAHQDQFFALLAQTAPAYGPVAVVSPNVTGSLSGGVADSATGRTHQQPLPHFQQQQHYLQHQPQQQVQATSTASSSPDQPTGILPSSQTGYARHVPQVQVPQQHVQHHQPQQVLIGGGGQQQQQQQQQQQNPYAPLLPEGAAATGVASHYGFPPIGVSSGFAQHQQQHASTLSPSQPSAGIQILTRSPAAN